MGNSCFLWRSWGYVFDSRSVVAVGGGDDGSWMGRGVCEWNGKAGGLQVCFRRGEGLAFIMGMEFAPVVSESNMEQLGQAGLVFGASYW